jgi:hypothetical protein
MIGEIVERTKPKPSYVKVSVVLRPNIHRFLRAKSKQTHFSMSKIIRKALREYFAGEF